MTTIYKILSSILFLFMLSACNKYDALVLADEECQETWANVEANYQRRFDLIPNLVKTVSAGAASEKEILTKVAEARASATQANINFHDEESLKDYTESQDKAFETVRTTVFEAYPELKSTEAFIVLQAQIEGTENRILLARTKYNEAVRKYNTELRKVKGVAVNTVTGQPFSPRAFFKTDTGASNAPSVEF